MKKLLLMLSFVLVYVSGFSQGPPTGTYTPISTTGYNWLRGYFRALHIPAGPTPVLQAGQWTGSGAMFVDTTGADAGLYVYFAGSWLRMADTTDISVLANIGSGYRIYNPWNGGFRTLFSGYGVGLDSTTNANALTISGDTAVGTGMISWPRFNKLKDSLNAVYLKNITGLVTAGTNITVTGSGTSVSPYMINSSGGGSTDNMQKALYFPGGTTEAHVDGGYYFVEEYLFGNGSFEAWIRPQDEAQYVISDGYGGVHAWLFGVLQANDTMFALTGNVWYESNVASLESRDFIKIGTAHHIAVALIGGYLVTYIDGVPSWRTAWAHPGRNNAISSGCGQAFIGGSDHQNFRGTIFRVRMYEGSTPFTSNTTRYIQQKFSADDPYVSFLHDYTSPGVTVIPDLSQGYLGMQHNGTPSYSATVLSPVPIRPIDSIPHYRPDSIYQSPYTGQVTSAPGGCKIFDAFERNDEVPAFNLPDIDSTQSGTLGKKKYLYGNGGWTSGLYAGIINGYCYFSYLGGLTNYVYVTGNSNDQDVRVTSISNSSERQCQAIARYTDASNMVFAQISGQDLNLYKVVGGVQTALGYFNQTTGFTELKLVVSGNDATVYADGVSRITSSSLSDVPSSNNSGFGSNNVFSRIKKFEVY